MCNEKIPQKCVTDIKAFTCFHKNVSKKSRPQKIEFLKRSTYLKEAQKFLRERKRLENRTQKYLQ